MKRIFTKNYYYLIPILILYSISLFTMHKYTIYFNKHLMWLTTSLIIYFLIIHLNLQKLIKYHYVFYFFTIFLLVLVLFNGKSVNGSQAWLDFYFFNIQPSELAKISLFLTLTILTIQKQSILKIILLTLIPAVLTYLEPDTGAIIVYLIILLICLLNYGLKKKTLLLLTTLFILLTMAIIYLYLFQNNLFIKIFGTSIFYRLDRLKSFTTLDNIQIENALASISTHNYLYFPEAHTDFIFALTIANISSLFLPIIIACYIYILLSFNYLALHPRKLPKISFQIIFYILLFQVFENIFMNIGLSPIIGIPLPFLSYGGSSTISLIIIIALAQNFLNHRYKIN